MAAVLRFKDVSRRIDDHMQLSHLNLTLQEGEILCLLGPSGCGKSSTLRLAAGFEQPDDGEIYLGGSLVAAARYSLPPEKREMGMVFQDYALFPHLDVLGNIAFGLRHLPSSERLRRSHLLLERLRIDHLAGQYPHTLSGGEMQRTALARALAPIPRIVLLDEPFSELDPQLRSDIRDDTLHILKEVGTAAIMVTHDAEEAMFMADRIAVMKNGQIIQTDTPHKLYNEPKDAFAASFFGEINVFHTTAQQGQAMTPFGPVRAQACNDNDPIAVVLRAEAIGFAQVGSVGQNFGRATVVASRLLGRASLIHVSYMDGQQQLHHLHARINGLFLPAPGMELELRVDLPKSMVFCG
jgi:iron(III) transport system ATP-binding protein